MICVGMAGTGRKIIPTDTKVNLVYTILNSKGAVVKGFLKNPFTTAPFLGLKKKVQNGQAATHAFCYNPFVKI